MAEDLEMAKVVHQIINTPITDTAAIEAILKGTTPELRDAALASFRNSENLRALFPEYAMYFDRRSVN